MKIIATDNYGRDEVSDRLVSSDLDQKTGDIMLASLNAMTYGGNQPNWFYRMVDDDYRLSKGMEDLV